MRSIFFVPALIVSGLIGGLFSWWLQGRPQSQEAALAPISTQTPVTAVPLSRLSLSPLVEKTAAAVVNIAVLQPSPYEQNPLLQDPYFRRFFGVPDGALAPSLSAGSGVIVDADKGIVLTNHHVIRNARAIEVTLSDQRTVQARLLGTSPETDIAVLQIDAPRLAQLPLGNSDVLKVGDYVVAIGNPFQIGQTVTAGIVSALGRSRRGGSPAYVQTDAPINPGNSGGPLISMSGEVIGINSAIIGPGQGNVGIGLAVPSNTARAVLDAVLQRQE
ncbi:trypsin-like peptidase domain-containing protein [Sphingosinicella rhizophila]|uniref:Trypsin-like peptidase domain-containing protein n=1 Tax=Sphingosinicella rhizophila TaxID=3050082 RepID=A0ABU3Q401_9SPHN|nr:trypsin-like peptidase domain-containing protein [Sphingosinicella sp. GR2756]MDT9598141.1 trypsin-like peptidase domain-containing protein [Sphingosinicella sp. GR2756]